MWGKKKTFKGNGGFRAIREIEGYNYPSFLLFPGEGEEEREGDFDILLPN